MHSNVPVNKEHVMESFKP